LTRERPPLTEGAKETLKKYKGSYGTTILNIAERRVLDCGRTEINESDMLEAQRNVRVRIPRTSRKWGIRALITFAFALLVAQVAAFYQLFSSSNPQNLALVIQVWLISPNVVILFLMIVFTWIFKDDWL